MLVSESTPSGTGKAAKPLWDPSGVTVIQHARRSVQCLYGNHWPWIIALYFSLAIICGYVSWSKVVVDSKGNIYTNQTSVELQRSLISDNPEGVALWPGWRTRIFIPYILAAGERYLGIPYRVSHDGVRLAFIFLAALVFHWHLRTWFSLQETLTGTVLMLGTITITFNNWIPIVNDFPELVGMTVCVASLIRQRWTLIVVGLCLYTFNRETSIIFLLVAVVYLYAAKASFPRMLMVNGAIVLTWWTTFMTARHLAGVEGSWFLQPGLQGQGQGFLHEVIGLVQELWPRRLASILALLDRPHPYNVNWAFVLVLNIFWLLPVIAWKSIPVPLRSLYIGGLLGGLTIFVLVGVLNEAGRLMIPLYPLLYPAGLYVLFHYVLHEETRLPEPQA